MVVSNIDTDQQWPSHWKYMYLSYWIGLCSAIYSKFSKGLEGGLWQIIILNSVLVCILVPIQIQINIKTESCLFICSVNCAVLLSGLAGFRSTSASVILSRKKSAGLSNWSHSRPNNMKVNIFCYSQYSQHIHNTHKSS